METRYTLLGGLKQRGIIARQNLRYHFAAFGQAVGILLFAGCSAMSPDSRNPHLSASEKMMWSTYPLATNGGMATGFVVTRKDSNAPGGVVPVFVTSYHVLDTIGKGPLSIGVRVPSPDRDPEVFLIQLTAWNAGTPYYVKHPRFDIAAFELRMPPAVARQIALPSFIEETALTNRSARVHAGDEIAFLGYPEVLPGTPGAFPVLRSGRIASYSSGILRNERKFLVNADAYPGDSGAPVFTVQRNGTPQLLGMLVQRIGPDRKKFVPLALAVDAVAIRETLQLLAARERADGGSQSGQNRIKTQRLGDTSRRVVTKGEKAGLKPQRRRDAEEI